MEKDFLPSVLTPVYADLVVPDRERNALQRGISIALPTALALAFLLTLMSVRVRPCESGSGLHTQRLEELRARIEVTQAQGTKSVCGWKLSLLLGVARAFGCATLNYEKG